MDDLKKIEEMEKTIDGAYSRGYKTALDSVKLLIMSNFPSDEKMISLLKMIEELEEEEDDEE